MEGYTQFEQAFGVGDVVNWDGRTYIVREVYEDENGYYYGIERAANEPTYPSFAEVPQEDLAAL